MKVIGETAVSKTDILIEFSRFSLQKYIKVSFNPSNPSKINNLPRDK